MKKWIYAVVAVCLLVYMCGGSDESDEPEYEKNSGYEQVSESSVSVDDSAPSWIQGRWVCTYSAQGMPNCPNIVDISGGYISEYYDDECYEGTYEIDGNRILGNRVVSSRGYAGVNVVYYMDMNRKKLYKNIMGTACYYNKQ